MAIMTITWYTAKDDLVCPICRPLHKFVWTFDTTKSPFPNELFSPKHGVRVWDMIKDEPRPHGQHILNCRCALQIQFDAVEIQKAITDRLTWAYQMKALPQTMVVPVT